MQITQDEIESAVEQFLHKAIRYEQDGAFGVHDMAETYSQVRELIIVTLLTDPNAVYYLLSVGIKEKGEVIREYLAALTSIESRLPSLVRAPVKDPIVEKDIQRMETSLLLVELEGSTAAKERLNNDFNTASLKLGRKLVNIDVLDIPAVEAVREIQELLYDMQERHDIILADIEDILGGPENLKMSPLFSNLRERVVNAAKDLMLDLRVERVTVNEEESQRTARQRLIELQAAKVAIQLLSEPVNFEAARIATGNLPSGTNIVLSAIGESSGKIQQQGTKSGGFDILPPSTLIVSDESASPTTISFPKTSIPSLIGKAPPAAPTGTAGLYFGVEFEDFSLGPYDVEINVPGSYYKHGELRTTGTTSSVMIGHFCQLRYTGDKSSLSSAARAAAEANESVTYRIVGYQGGSTSFLYLDPPLPTGQSPAPLTSWELTLFSLVGRWEVPSSQGSFTSYLDRLQQQLSGPTDNSNRDAFQPWRIYSKITGTQGGFFMSPGEPVRNAAGDKQGVVVFHDTSGLYIHPMASPFVNGESLTGLSYGGTMSTITITHRTAEIPGNSGQLNTARWMEAVVGGSNLHLRARTSLGGGTAATFTGAQLDLTLSTGERGFSQLGVFPGDTVTVNGIDYVVSAINSDTQAIMTTAGSGSGLAWTVPMPKAIKRLSLYRSGPIIESVRYDTATYIGGAPNSGHEAGQPYVVQNYVTQRLEELPADSLEMNIPQLDVAGKVSAAEVVDAINDAAVANITADEVREVVDSRVNVGKLTYNSDNVEVPDDLPSGLEGYYFIPTEGEHRGEDFLILSDTPGAPRKLKVDRVATVTENPIPAFRIESRSVRLSHTGQQHENAIIFGAGTAHSLLGFPSSETVYGQFSQAQLTDGKLAYDADDAGVVVGDVVESYGLEILEVADDILTFAGTISGDQQEVSMRIPGTAPTAWSAFNLYGDKALTEIGVSGFTDFQNLLDAFIPLATPNLQIQPADVAAFGRKLDKARTLFEDLLTQLDNFVIPEIRAGREVLEMLDENGYDNVRQLLTRGLYDEFFDLESYSTTAAGNIQSVLGQLSQTFGDRRSPAQIEEAEEPLAVIDIHDGEDDDFEGLQGDQIFDDNDDGEVDL